MEYRVVEYEQYDGEKFYRLQYRWLCFWRMWYKTYWCVDGYASELVQFNTNAAAEKYANDFYKMKEEKELQKIITKRVV